MLKVLTLLPAVTALLTLSGALTAASAQHTTADVALGSDFWTGSMTPELFQLHENGGARACSGTEKFVTVRGNLGFCIDADENAAGTQEWEDARETCAAAEKRLPEPAEFKWACQAGITGLNNMTDDWEWASNFAQTQSGSSAFGYAAPSAGNANCKAIFWDWVWNGTSNAATSRAFRCVH